MSPPTHDVTNQTPPLVDQDLFTSDRPLVDALTREAGEAAQWASTRARSFGQEVGRARTLVWGDQANRFPPELKTHDRFGHRIDEVEFHPAWHELLALGMRHSLHNLPWREPRRGAQVARAALVYMQSQVETGVQCPLTMTFASLPALRHEPAIAEHWESLLLGTEYERRLLPAREKSAVLIGMAMTEKQGGSDVRANTTQAEESGEVPGGYRLRGHKWFCSAPMSDAFLTLAQANEGITCFLVPRILPDGTRNPFAIQRLKSKLGNRSNASSEIEYEDTFAQRLGSAGRGVRTIIDMVHHTRLDCVASSAGLMRQALAQAAHHARHRSVFGRSLIEQPLMQSVLADLALEVEGAVALALRLARAYELAAEDEAERAFARIATAVGKYFVCKRAPGAIYEAMECLGGNGYVEESVLPRIYREAPVNAIWEGSGNVICLDVLRAIVREPETLSALQSELEAARGASRHYDEFVRALEVELQDKEGAERRARLLVERLALALEASLLLRAGAPAVAEAFCASRLANAAHYSFGALPSSLELRPTLERILAE